MGVNVDELISTNLPYVQVPPTSNPLGETDYQELQRLVDPLTSTCGKELYRRTVDFVGRKLSIHLHLNSPFFFQQFVFVCLLLFCFFFFAVR